MQTKRKIFVVDTSVLVYDPEALFAFDEHDVVLALKVIEELDAFKGEASERGANARAVFRSLDSLQSKSPSHDQVLLGEGRGRLFIHVANVHFSFVGLENSTDNYLLGVARSLAEKVPECEVVLVTRDVPVRVKAAAFGIRAEDYRGKAVDASDIGKIGGTETDSDTISVLFSKKRLELANDKFDAWHESRVVTCGQASAIVRRKGNVLHLVDTKRIKCPVGVKPRNAEQWAFFDALLDPEVRLVVGAGVAGSGKTLLSMAAGVQGVEEGKFDKVLITKAIQAVGNDIGYTKGTKEEKMAEWVKPFTDNLDFIFRGKKGKGFDDDPWEDIIEVDAITYIRGRSLMNRFIVVDEVQNLTPKIIRTIVSRVSDSSKLVLLGDFSQIDNPYCNRRNNGLTHAMTRLYDEGAVAVFNLTRSERGLLPEIAERKL